MDEPKTEVLTLINSRFASMSKSEQRVAQYIQGNPDEIVMLSLQALAGKCGTSDATVLRFCRSLGYSGFQDMKSTFIPELLRRGVNPTPELTNAADPSAAYSARLAEDTRRTMSLLSQDTVNTIAEALVCSSRNLMVGLAGSAGVGRIFADTLSSAGVPATAISDRVEIERACDTIRPGQVVIGISHSGETPEVIAALHRSRERNAVTVGMTNYSPSSVEKAATHVLLTSVAEGLLGSYSCHPRILELVVLEMLMASVAGKLAAGGGSRREEHYR